jgi:hypothetical protein
MCDCLSDGIAVVFGNSDPFPMRASIIAVLLLLFSEILVNAGQPKSVIITNDNVVIDGTIVGSKEPKAGFQISLKQALAALGKPSSIGRNWTTASYLWENDGIALGVEWNKDHCAWLKLYLFSPKALDIRPYKSLYKGSISVAGVPITSATKPGIFAGRGFRLKDGEWNRTIGQHSIKLDFATNKSPIPFVSIELPDADGDEWRMID